MFKCLSLVASVLLLRVTPAAAQACCAGSTAFAPARLALHETYLVGVGVRALAIYGSSDGARRFVPSPRSTGELGLQQDLFAAAKLFDRLQVALLVPVVETWRQASGSHAFGGGIGDVQLNLRYDFTLAGASLRIPGLALLGGLTTPTGRPPTSTSAPLATDATGVGAWQLAAGAAIEQSFGRWLVNLTGSVFWRLPQRIGSISSQLGVLFSVFAAVAYSLTDAAVVALVLSYAPELDTWADGARIAGSGRTGARATVAFGYLLTDHWRLQANVFADAPRLSFNQPLAVGGSLLVVRSW